MPQSFSFTKIPTQTSKNTSAIVTLQTAILTLQADVFDLTSSAETLQTYVNTLQSSVGTLQNDVINLTSSAGTLQNDVINLTSSTETLQVDIINLTSSTGTLQTNVNTLQSSIGTLQVNVNTLQSSTGTLQADVINLTSSIGTLQVNVNTLQSSIGTLQADVINLTSSTETLQVDVINSTSSIGTLQVNVTTLQSSVGTLQTDIITLQSSVETLSTQLDSLDNENLVFDVNTAIVDGVLLDTQFNLLLYNSGTYDFYISWGDGSFNKITVWNDSALLHTYPRVGIYTVILVGLVLNIFPLQKVVAIKSFGKLSTQNNFYAMYDLVSLPSNPYNIMGGTLTRTPYAIFRECTDLTHIDISHYVWTSEYYNGFYNFCTECSEAEVINMKGMIVYDPIAVMSGAFSLCSKVEELDFSTLDISALVSADYMCTSCTKLKYIKGWGGYTFSDVVTLLNAFSNTTDLIDIDIDATANFTSLTNISYIFTGSGISNALATRFITAFANSPLTTVNSAFKDCVNLTSLDLSSLNISAVTDMNDFASGVTINTTEYSDALIYWATLTLQNGVTCNMGNSKYNSAGAIARAYIITTFNWTILDGGAL